MILKELIEKLKIYEENFHDFQVLFSFDSNYIANFDIEVYKDKIYIDLDYLNILDDGEL